MIPPVLAGAEVVQVRVAVAFAVCGISGAALAAGTPDPNDLTQPALPTFALSTPPEQPSPWTGLYVGSEIFGVSGGKGIRGGFGGSGFAGYNREFDSGVVVGLQGNAGYAPGIFKHSAITGFNFASTDVRLGYDMGRFMPFVTAGVGFAKPNVRSLGGYTGPANAANDLFNTRGDLRSFQTVGAGFAYRFNSKLTVELAVQAFRSDGFVAP